MTGPGDKFRDLSYAELRRRWESMSAEERAALVDRFRVERDEDVLRALIAPREPAESRGTVQ